MTQGTIWIADDDPEVAQALVDYLTGHLHALQVPPDVYSGAEEVCQHLTGGSLPAVVIIGTDAPQQAAADIHRNLCALGAGDRVTLIALGAPPPQPDPCPLTWQMWPLGDDDTLAECVRQAVFGGPRRPST